MNASSCWFLIFHFLTVYNKSVVMAEKVQSTANVSNGANGASTRPPLKKQDSDKDFDDYFVRLVNTDYS